MAYQGVERTVVESILEVLAEHGLDRIAEAVPLVLNEVMKLEREVFLEAGCRERSDRRRGHANGFKPKRLQSRLGELDLRIPRVRPLPGGSPLGFYPRALERGVRSERAAKRAVAEMYVQGVSTRKVAEVTREPWGLEVTRSQVSRAAAELDAELQARQERPLPRCRYLVLDARYEKLRHGGSVVDTAVLPALGVREEDGRRMLLGVSVSRSEAEAHWPSFLESLQARGLVATDMVTSDDHAAFGAARQAVFPNLPWQRCQFHLQQNAQACVPRAELRTAVAREPRGVFAAADRADAEARLARMVEAWRPRAPRLATWLEENVPEGFTVFALPEAHRRRLRTTNALERLSRELKRRTRVVTLFPNEASLLRRVSALAAELSEERETGRVYLRPEPDLRCPPAGPDAVDLAPPERRSRRGRRIA